MEPAERIILVGAAVWCRGLIAAEVDNRRLTAFFGIGIAPVACDAAQALSTQPGALGAFRLLDWGFHSVVLKRGFIADDIQFINYDRPNFSGFPLLRNNGPLHHQTVPARSPDVPVLLLSDLHFATDRGLPPRERAPRAPACWLTAGSRSLNEASRLSRHWLFPK
jgi:hypothetical protein